MLSPISSTSRTYEVAFLAHIFVASGLARVASDDLRLSAVRTKKTSKVALSRHVNPAAAAFKHVYFTDTFSFLFPSFPFTSSIYFFFINLNII